VSVTLAELIEARDGLAVIMSHCDDEEASLYVPIFERLEREVELAQAKQDALARARQLARSVTGRADVFGRWSSSPTRNPPFP